MVEIGPEDFMRALVFARTVKKMRPREDFYRQLVGRLGELIFYETACRAVPRRLVGALSWAALPTPVAKPGLDLRINGWKVDVKTPVGPLVLDWPACKQADLFPKVVLAPDTLTALTERYKTPARSTPIGLLDDPIPRIRGEVAGWIGVGSAELLAGEASDSVRVDAELAAPAVLWALLAAHRGPDIRLADAEWQKARLPQLQPTPRRGRAGQKGEVVLLPPRRRTRVDSAA